MTKDQKFMLGVTIIMVLGCGGAELLYRWCL